MRELPKLDARLQAALEMGGTMKTFADIGADHGRLSAVLLAGDPERVGFVTDISEKALSKARERLHRLGLENRTRFLVSDGLTDLSQPVDTVFILGMGGDTIRHILLTGADRLCGAAVVVSPHTEHPLVREALQQIGYRIRQERIVLEDGWRYLLMRAEPALPGEASHMVEELYLGPCLMKEKPAEWLPVLQRKERLLSREVAAMESAGLEKDAQRLKHAKWELAAVRKVLSDGFTEMREE